MKKNIVILVAIFAFSIPGLSQSKDSGPEPITWNKELKQLLYDDDEVINDGSKIMKMTSPYRALDAAIVPITVSFKIDQNGEEFIRDLTLIVDENPSPLVSKFKFTKKSGNASLTTRIRIDKYTYVRAIAETNKNNKFMVANFVKAAGGCSAPSLGDMDAIMARLGKMKMKFIKTTNVENELNVAEFVVSHPNFSGLQFNQLTRAEIPAHFINYLKIEQDNQTILEATPDISLSEDPSFIFNYSNSGGPLNVYVEDSEGQKFNKQFPISEVLTKN